jgi:CHASE1-domain containing sensor protein
MRDERAANEIAAARDGISGYRVKAVATDGALVTAPERNEYFPVYFTTDKQNADLILGLDLADGGVREDVLKRARDSNELSVSKLIVLHSGTGNRRGFFVLSPVYKKGLPHQTVEERRRNLEGFVQGVFQLDSMVETILTPLKTPLDTYIFEPDSGPTALPIHTHSSSLRPGSAEPKPFATLLAGPH